MHSSKPVIGRGDRFLRLSIIGMSQGQDELIGQIRELADKVYFEEQRAVKALQLQFINDTLSPRVVSNSTYIEQEKTPCLSGTRVDILAEIDRWIADTSVDAPRLLWLSGPPGSGKSTITTTVCRGLRDRRALSAQFFINRNYAPTMNPKCLLPSIAIQLIHRHPELVPSMHDILQDAPSLVEDITEAQAQGLFVQPIRHISSLRPSEPVIIVIDALDESDPTRLWRTANIIFGAIKSLPPQAKLLISSRVEDEIQSHFRKLGTNHIYLDTSAASSLDDVNGYLRNRLSHIAERFGLQPLGWPTEDEVKRLCKQASGLFIWAVTATSFIETTIKLRGRSYLGRLVKQLNKKGMGDIRKLYTAVLESAFPASDGTDPWLFEEFRQIVGSIVGLGLPYTVEELTTLLDLRDDDDIPVDIENFIRRFRTVLVAGNNEITSKTVPRLHKSFYEFIISDGVDARFRIDRLAFSEAAFQKCLNRFDGFRDLKYLDAAMSCRFASDDDGDHCSLYTLMAKAVEVLNRVSDITPPGQRRLMILEGRTSGDIIICEMS
ncbi:hypothetical protein JAAARDRAFT_41921 [Jaapia argillacea MUCL 33604]|uniref:Nephrocystin 3-like N-terminal domain-containing protein n=1 Tax=Jaapia argillacea MUCL 33604 TaxID=933084 RepID=A0A067PHV4_9AGAM|nr:hypothetical protein JAAARDRAFT_41921 [Jaapia argillacea MUCL 33604]